MAFETIPPHDDRHIILETTLALERQKKKADSYYPPDFFSPLTPDEIATFIKPYEVVEKDEKPFDVSREEGKALYRELASWNIDKHLMLNYFLETPYLRTMERITRRIISDPEDIRRRAQEADPKIIPYKFAGLPPNLYDHLDAAPFIPATTEGVFELVNQYAAYMKRLETTRPAFWRGYPKNSKERQAHDLILELLRLQKDDPLLFEAPAARAKWRRYNLAFKEQEPKEGFRPMFHQNVHFTNYANNRHFTATGGFFDKTDGMFGSYLLADFPYSSSPFTSQIRVPIGQYGQEAAEDLMRSTFVMMQLITEDQFMTTDVVYSPEEQKFIIDHLMRSRDLHLDSHDETLLFGHLRYAMYQTALEGMASVSALSAWLEGDGIPGHETDIWSGLYALLSDDVYVKMTAVMAQAVVVPTTLHGNYFRHPLEPTPTGYRMSRDVAEKIQEIQDRRTKDMHGTWMRYYLASEGRLPTAHALHELREKDETAIPVRFGLHCPFKGDVVRQFAEALMLCRATIRP